MSDSPTIRFDAARDPGVLNDVIALGDRNSRTLGFLPYAGFGAAAAEDRIVVAQANGVVLGYCLFDLPRDIVRIVQVCISEQARGAGLAKTLVDAVGARHPGRLGLVLKCRADWPADQMWPKLGFVPQTQVPGRSRERHLLTVWWRSHGHADLFSLLEETRATGRAAAIDSNVYSDLHSGLHREGSRGTAVLAPLIAAGDLNLVLLPSLREETYATSNAQERKRFLHAQVHYAYKDAPSRRETLERLITDIPDHVLAKDASLRRDAKLIAEAHANGIDLFVTRDRNAIRYLFEPAAELDIDVVHPSDVPTLLDVEAAADSYRPAQLEETTYTIQRLGRALHAEEVSSLLDRSGGERIVALRSQLEDLASRSTADMHRNVLLSANDDLQATWAESTTSDVLEVPLFRIPGGPLQTTLAAQLSRQLRTEALHQGRNIIWIQDLHMPRHVHNVLVADGFYADESGLTALVLPLSGPWAEVSAAAQHVAQGQSTGPLSRLLQLPGTPSPAQTFELERLWSPVKIFGQGIANYLVPIKPAFASQLLGHPASLMNRTDDLGLSREHVYYSSRRGPVQPPGRILWYVSGRNEGAVVATSNLVEVRVDTPRRLHRLYARLGVWQLSDVINAAKKDQAAAFRFTNTEIFTRPVGLDRVRAAAPNGQRLLLRSTQVLTDEWYERIYREGVQR